MCDGFPLVRDKSHRFYQHWFPLSVRPSWIGTHITLLHSFHRLTFARSCMETSGSVQLRRLCPEALGLIDPCKLAKSFLVRLFQAPAQIDQLLSSTQQAHVFQWALALASSVLDRRKYSCVRTAFLWRVSDKCSIKSWCRNWSAFLGRPSSIGKSERIGCPPCEWLHFEWHLPFQELLVCEVSAFESAMLSRSDPSAALRGEAPQVEAFAFGSRRRSYRIDSQWGRPA